MHPLKEIGSQKYNTLRNEMKEINYSFFRCKKHVMSLYYVVLQNFPSLEHKNARRNYYVPMMAYEQHSSKGIVYPRLYIIPQTFSSLFFWPHFEYALNNIQNVFPDKKILSLSISPIILSISVRRL